MVASDYPIGLAYNDKLASLGGTLVCASTPVVPLNLGGYPLHASGLVSDNYAIGYVVGRLTVVVCPVTLVRDMPPNNQAQYSDLLGLAAHVVNCGGTIYPSGAVQFRLGSALLGSGSPDAQGAVSLPVRIMNTAGDYKLSAVFGPTDSRFTGSSAGPLDLAITREEATAKYTGATTFAVNNVTKKGTVQLSVTIKDITATNFDDDPLAGDIRTARVRFEKPDGSSINSACDSVTVGLVSASDAKVGVASCSFQSVAATFQVRVVVLGNYAGQSEEITTVKVGNGGTGGGAALPLAHGPGEELLAVRREGV